MDEYTPNTAEVRARYADEEYANTEVPWQANVLQASRDEFDRWLQSVKAEACNEGAVAQREATIGYDFHFRDIENPYENAN